MELDQNFANFFPNNTKGAVSSPPDTSGGLSSDFSNFFPKREPQGQPARRGEPLDPAVVGTIADNEGLNPSQKRMMTALLNQESGYGTNARTSTDGAQGAGQIKPDTFKRYAKEGEDIGKTEHNIAVMARIVKDLGTKFKDDPARVATGYFSGDGNVNPQGDQAWKMDHRDGNGKSVSSYVSDVLGRFSRTPEPQASAPATEAKPEAPALPDLAKAKPWADIANDMRYVDMDAATKAQYKQAYFDYWVAPHAGRDAAGLREQFMNAPDPSQASPARLAAGAKELRDQYAPPPLDESVLETAPKPGAISMPGSVMDGTVPARGDLPTTSKAPVDQKFHDAFNAQWDAANVYQRAELAKQPGLIGQLARDRAGALDQLDATMPDNLTGNTADKIDTRAEKRAGMLTAAGEQSGFSQRAAREAAARGVAPGKEVDFIQRAYGTASQSDLDMATKEFFDKQVGANNPLVRGTAQVLLGGVKVFAGLNQLYWELPGTGNDAVSAEYANSAKKMGDWARRKEAAIGTKGTFLERNLEGAISSIGQQLPWMMGGAMAATEKAAELIPLVGIGIQTVAQEFSDARASGMNFMPALGRASIFAAFEVLGEKLGLHDQMKALRGATHGMDNGEILHLLGSALMKELPGELFTTTGEFATDKWAPFGMAMNPNATMKDYLGQVADTIAQTLMQSGLMGAGTTGVAKLARDKGYTPEIAEADAQRARTAALSKAQEMFSSKEKPAAPPPPPAPAAPPATESKPATPEQPVKDASLSDQDVLDFAESRFQQLRDKRDGTSEFVPGDERMVAKESAGSGLTKAEGDEFDKLTQARKNVDALRGIYGFDQPTTKESTNGTQAAETKQAEAKGPEAPAAAVTKEDVAAAVQDESWRKENVPTEVKAEAPAAPKTEKQANEQRDYSDKWFGSEEKARDFIAKKGIGATHHVLSDGGKYLIKANAAVTAPAHDAATSPQNDLPEPTQAQKEAGNYKKGHVTFDGLDLSIENPVGSQRSGKDPSGKDWSVGMTSHYGYVKRTTGADGDQLDVYLAEHPAPNSPVFVFDQYGLDGRFDEHKAVLGATTLEQAKEIYDAHFSDQSGPKRRRAVQAMPVEEFKKWAQSADAQKPVVPPKTEREAKAAREGEKTTQKPVAEKQQSTDNLDAMFDQVLKEEVAKDQAAAPKTEKQAQSVKKPATPQVPMSDGAKYVIPTFATGQYQKPTTEKQARSAREAAASAAKNTAAGLGAAIDGLGELFGGKGKLSSGLTFDEETYAKAKPLFRQAIANMQDAGNDLREAMRQVIRMVLDKFGAAAAQNMKPYVVRFIADTAKESVEKPAEQAQTEPKTKDTSNADLVQTNDVPGGDSSEVKPDAIAGNRDSEPVGAGVATGRSGADRSGDLPAGAEGSGAAGTARPDTAGDKPSGKARDSAGVRPESLPADDFVIDGEDIGKGGLAKKYRDNIAAIKILKALDTEGRVATPEERKALARYVGWGAMKGPFDPENKAWAKQHEELKALLTDGGFKIGSKMLRDNDYSQWLREKDMDEQQNTGEPEFNNIARNVQNNIVQFFGNQDEAIPKFGWYDKTFSTQYAKAMKNKDYGKVFGLLNAMQNEVSLTAIRPAELAPGVLPRVDDVKSAARTLVRIKSNQKALSAAAGAIFEGTLAGNDVMGGKVWTVSELQAKGLDDTSIALYMQARRAIDASLDELAAGEAYAMAQGKIPKAMRRQVIDNPQQAEALIKGKLNTQLTALRQLASAARASGDTQGLATLENDIETYQDTIRKVEKIFLTAYSLKQAGYAPLMRFGKYSVLVQAVDPATGNLERDADGHGITLFYGRYDTEREAQAVKKQYEDQYGDGARVKADIHNPDKHELYSGITPETLEIFAEAIGAKRATDAYIRLTRSDRSSLKRRLERKGTPGYSLDLPRVLSNFITSNARQASQQYYMRDITNAVKYIPHGAIQQEAQRLVDFVVKPDDAGAVASSLVFAWFIGGSVASAAVNATQPVLMTLPYLSQFGAAKASVELTKAQPYAMGAKQITDQALRNDLKKASREGIVDAQEIFHLYNTGSMKSTSWIGNGPMNVRNRLNAAMTLWGSMFSVVESYNRKLTFIAAWNMAKQDGNQNPYGFAVRAVNQTQGIYNKVNRPNFGQNAWGRQLLQFKQYSFSYVELAARMWRNGPEGKRAVLMMLAILILVSGEAGLPLSKLLEDAIDTIGQLAGFDTNTRMLKRRLAYAILGKNFGDLALYGLSSQLPLDFSGRLGLGNMIPGTGILKPSDGIGNVRSVTELLGPTASIAKQFGDAATAATEGKWGKAVENLMPTAVRNIMAASSMLHKGHASDFRGNRTVDTTPAEAVIKAVGFNPTKVAAKSRADMPFQQDVSLQKAVESSIVSKWAQGIADNKPDEIAAAQKKLADWNKNNPNPNGTPSIVIHREQIQHAAQKLNSDKNTRLMKSTPREMRGRLGLDTLR